MKYQVRQWGDMAAEYRPSSRYIIVGPDCAFLGFMKPLCGTTVAADNEQEACHTLGDLTGFYIAPWMLEPVERKVRW